MRGLGKGVSGKPYPRLCNARRPRLEPGTFRLQAVRLYRLHQARPSKDNNLDEHLIFYYRKKQLEFHVKGKKLAEHLMYDPQMSSSMSHQQRTIF